jgi:predicted Zn-dependent peptidase
MIRAAILGLAAVALVACADSIPQASRRTSPGGTAFTLLDIRDAPDVSIQIAWATDWAFRDGVNQAAPHVGAELVLAGGAQSLAADEAAERFADLAASAYLAPAPGHVIGGLTVPRARAAEAVAIANAHLRFTGADDVAFARARDGLRDRIALARSRPDQRVFETLGWAVLGDRTLRRALWPDAPRAVEVLTPDDVADWRRGTLIRTPREVVVAGDLDAAVAGELVDALLDGLPEPVGRSTAAAEESDFSPRRILIHAPGSATAHVAIVGPLPPTRMGGEMADLILMDALGDGMGSVLFKAIRTNLRAGYGFDAALAQYGRENRFMVLAGEVDPARLAAVVDAALRAYESFRAEGAIGDFASRRARVEAIFAGIETDVGRVALAELQSALDGFPTGRALEFAEEIASIDARAVEARLRAEYPASDAMLVVAITPDADALEGACVIAAPRQAADCPRPAP